MEDFVKNVSVIMGWVRREADKIPKALKWMAPAAIREFEKKNRDFEGREMAIFAEVASKPVPNLEDMEDLNRYPGLKAALASFYLLVNIYNEQRQQQSADPGRGAGDDQRRGD